MIYIQRLYKIGSKITVQSYTLNIDLEEGLEYAEEVLLCDTIPIIYLKEKGSNNLLEVKAVGYHTVISYILDLFDFEQEVKNSIK